MGFKRMNRDSLCGEMEKGEFLSGKMQWAKVCEHEESAPHVKAREMYRDYTQECEGDETGNEVGKVMQRSF